MEIYFFWSRVGSFQKDEFPVGIKKIQVRLSEKIFTYCSEKRGQGILRKNKNNFGENRYGVNYPFPFWIKNKNQVSFFFLFFFESHKWYCCLCWIHINRVLLRMYYIGNQSADQICLKQKYMVCVLASCPYSSDSKNINPFFIF